MRIPLVDQPRRALGPEIEPPFLARQLVHGRGREHRSGAAPHQLTARILRVRRDELRQPVGVLLRRREPLQHESNPRLAHPQAPLLVVVGKVGLVRALEVRDVVAAELHEPPALQRVERPNDTGAAGIHRPKAMPVVALVDDVLRMGLPAIVESSVRVLGDLPNRCPDSIGVPAVLDQLFVDAWVVEHPRRLEADQRQYAQRPQHQSCVD